MVGSPCFTEISACRLCRCGGFEEVIDLGEQALTGCFPKAGEPEPPTAPLTVIRCIECGLVQLKHSVQLGEMYTPDYGYRSGINLTMRDHLAGIARSVCQTAALAAGDVVLDIGCNDGTLLNGYFVDGLVRIGIDPLAEMFRQGYADDMAAKAGFFDAALFLSASSGRKAGAVTSISMFYDLEDPDSFVADIAAILKDDGIWVLEQSYLPLMLETNAFDTICHEHLEYYALEQIKRMAADNGLRVFNVELNRCNGGSFRLFVCHEAAHHQTNEDNLDRLTRREAELALHTAAPYQAFRRRVSVIRDKLRELVIGEAERGKKIYVYGASTKGNVILQFCGLDHRYIKAAAERNPTKWGGRTPATGIPIVAEDEARADFPDYFLALPWHFKDEFIAREKEFLAGGGRFIFPLPGVEVIDGK